MSTFLSDTIADHLRANRRKVKEIDENGNILVIYQMNTFIIFPSFNKDNDGSGYVTIMLPNIDDLGDQNPSVVSRKCLQICANQRVVKAYITSELNVGLTYEFNFFNLDDLRFQIIAGLDALIDAKVQYRKL